MSSTHQQLFLFIAGKKFAVTAFHCKNDAISANYQCEVYFNSTDPLCCTPNETVCLSIKNQRYLHGIITSWCAYGKKQDLYFYKILFCSLLEKLNQVNNKNYAAQTLQEIIITLLQKNNVDQYHIQLTSAHPKISFLAQYQQSDLLCFENLLKQHACFYVWQQNSEKSVLTIFDDKQNLSTLFKGQLLSYKPFKMGITDEEVVFEKVVTQSSAGKEIYFFETNCCNLFPGQILHLSAQQNMIYNKTFRIINIEHQGEQLSDVIHQQQRSLLYKNKLSCMIFQKDFLRPAKKNKLLKTLTAQTAKQNNQALDEYGHYYLAFNYDIHTITPSFKRIQDFNGNQIAGMHFPLKDKTSVLTGFINDDLNTPVILGQIPTAIQPSPVTDKNPYQYIVRTASQSQFVLDDKEKNILLENKNNAVLFYPQGIKFTSHGGNIKIHNTQNYDLNTGLDYNIQTHHHYQQTYHQTSLLMTKQADFALQATKNITITSQQLIQLQGQAIKIRAKNTVEFLMTHQLLNIKNSLEIMALELLSFAAHQTKMQAAKQITINNNFSLQPNCLKINAHMLEIIAEKAQVYQNAEIN